MILPNEIDAASGPDSVSGLLFRRSLYALLIAVSAGMMIARIARVESSDPKSQTPFLSANDRSRWTTIRSLGDDGTYVIDHIIFDKKGNRVRGWHTIDLVRHRGPDGEQHYYSSKPTLLTTLLAGEYWLVKKVTGATLADQPGYVSRLMLILTNVLPLAGALWLLSRLIDELGTTDWGRIFAMAAACFGTFVTTYSVTLNNHTIAAICLVVAVAVSLPIFQSDCRAWWRFAAAGLSFGFLAANELPALAMLALAGTALLWKSPSRTLAAFLPAVLIVAAGAIITNYVAHGDWRTPYAHRSPGDNWYDYPGSYWLKENLRGIDIGEPSPLVYAFNCLIGHHGLFSLTPLWLLSAAGCALWLAPGKQPSLTPHASLSHASRLSPHLLLSATTLLISAVILTFYLTRPQLDRNYGGGTCCLRWLLWLTPLWLLTLLPTADWLSKNRWGRAFAIAALVISVFSAAYAADNPWSHPWIFDYWTSMGWIDY
jgi:hypothetical protein